MAECPPAAPQSYPAETPFKASLSGSATLTTSIVTIECSSASIEGQIGAETGNPLPLELTALTYGCKTTGGTECANTTLLPSASIEATKADDGTLSLAGGEVNFKCGKVINCYYPTDSLAALGGNPAQLIGKEAALEKIKGILCPNTATWSGITYTVAEPQPVYVES